MQKIYLTLVLLFSVMVFGQRNDTWKTVYKYELNGEIKLAQKEVEKIYKNAKRKNNEEQIVKCFFYLSKFEQVVNEDAQSEIINNLQQEIKMAKPVAKSLLNYIYSSILESYINNNYNIRKRTDVQNIENRKFLLWTMSNFDIEIENAYQDILKNKSNLVNVSIANYKDIFEISPDIDINNFSVYDFLFSKCLLHYKSKVSNWYNLKKQFLNFDYTILYEPSEQFILFNSASIPEKNIQKLIEIMQDYERHYFYADKNKVDVAYYNRMNLFVNSGLNLDTYFTKTIALEKTTNNKYLLQDLKVDRAEYYNQLTYEKKENLHEKSLLLLDSILQQKINYSALYKAENIKNNILRKQLSINLPKTNYPNENLRAFVNFKNVDSITVSYYRFPQKFNENLEYNYYNGTLNKINKDSLVNVFINKNKAFKIQKIKLSNANNHLENSTEFLLEKLDIGNYLIYIEANNNINEKDKAYTYSTILTTNIYVVEDNENKKDAFYIYHRKTGKPLENVVVKNSDENILTNKYGNAYFNLKPFEKGKNYYEKLEISFENDTLITKYNRHFSLSENKEKQDDYSIFEAQVMLHFDRAIYRPGQKMYYKGILIQKKDFEKSVVPFVSVHISIENASHKILKEFDTQTNEFGSFSGEFDIPKNELTGEFSINIDQADNIETDTKYYDTKNDKHSFWDNVDFVGKEEFAFMVEEYKRPTFEVTFENIKENYKLGDTLKIKGNAKALAGNTLTNATVKYNVSKSISKKNEYVPNQENYIENTIITDEKGNFEIEIIDNTTKLDSIQLITYTVNCNVIDTNGESRTAKETIKVGKETLQLKAKVNPTIYCEDKNNLTIEATTLNNFAINAIGVIKIYERKQKLYLNQRFYDTPSIQGFNRETFEQLFPNEPYSTEDLIPNETLVKTIDFNTKVNNTIALDFLKNYSNTNLKIVLESYDDQNNLIKTERIISIKSKQNPLSQHELFTYRDISNKNATHHIIEILSNKPNIYVTARYYDNQNKLQNLQTIQLNNGKGVLKFAKNSNNKNSINFHFSSIWENNSYSKTCTINENSIVEKLKIEVQSLRSKIEPGSEENWSFKIINSKLESEILASMYDISLDLFGINPWKGIKFYNNNEPNFSSIEKYQPTKSYLYINNFIHSKKYYFYSNRNPYIKSFGFDFNNPKNNFVQKKYLESIQTTFDIPKKSKQISGKIIDTKGVPTPGINVVVKGTKRGVQTNFDGNFDLYAVEGDTIIISGVGFKKQEFVIAKKHDFIIELEANESLLESVVIAQNTHKNNYDEDDEYSELKSKKALGCSATLISDEQNDFNYYRGNLYNKALQGKVAGIKIFNDGQVGASGKVIIRGTTSINNNSTPLYVIDGVPFYGDVTSINQDEILSIDLVKNSTTTVLYGNNASNGLIIITTKKGIKELSMVKTRTNFNETAFFYPHLKTDNDGKISFNFTTPESLTEWKLRLFAHNKNAETTYFETKVISQKDIMVQTNMPRFVREKDVITLKAKVVNMTYETKSGTVMLLLYNANSMEVLDKINSAPKSFICKPNQSVSVSWTITVPENLQGLQYKIVAKSGNYSDGEENVLPVLSNKILITESIPIWIKGNSKKEFIFDNLKNNISKTVKNHQFTLEYTSNPTWLALQSLPYLIEYEHDCAEQTFAKYYSNFIGFEIINSNPEISELLNHWKNNTSSISKLDKNENLKSIALSETPWLLDTESEEQKNKRLALLLESNTLKKMQENTIKKLEEKQLPSGAFSWFDGGVENLFITQHIIAGLGHLSKMFPQKEYAFDKIVAKAIPYMDKKYTIQHNENGKESIINLHYLYARSFYIEKMPISKKLDSLISIEKNNLKKNWIQYSLYQKALLAIVMNRYNENEFANKIITHLKQTVSRNEENVMYWVENKNGSFWHQSSIETQALLIEAFSEIDKDTTYIDEMKVWLLRQKQLHNWPTTKSTTEAIYALFMQGSNWSSIKNNTAIKIGNKNILTEKLPEKETETGYLKMNYKSNEIIKDMAQVSIENKSSVTGFGGIYWQYFENLESIKNDTNSEISISKNLYKTIKNEKGSHLIALTNDNIKIGDIITVQLIITTANDLEFVHLKDPRASCLEPIDVISSYKSQDNLTYYMSTKDIAVHFFFDTIKKGSYIIEYQLRVNNAGTFNTGVSTIQSMYAPEFNSHSTNIILKTE